MLNSKKSRYQVTAKTDSRDAMLDTYILSDAVTEARVEVAAKRGGMATRFTIAQAPIFFMDDDSLYDLSKNVRGGAPVLFPAPGKLAGDTYQEDAASYSMKQHGFARNAAWSVVGHDNGDGATLSLRMASSVETKKQFPYDFIVDFAYRLQGRTLTVEQTVVNTGDRPMPLHLGFHPYFYVANADKGKTFIASPATKMFDNVDKTEKPFVGVDKLPFADAEVDCHVLDHGSSSMLLERPNLPNVNIECSDEYKHWVLWTLPNRDFICVEPWTAAGNALNTKQNLLVVEPQQSRTLVMRITSV